VIAIIAILASMLLPALSKAREKARAVTCLSNQKGMGTIFAIYMNDFNSCLPVTYDATTGGNQYTWLGALGKFEYITLPKGKMGIAACPTGNVNTADYEGSGLNDGTTMENCASCYGMWQPMQEHGYWKFSGRPVFTVVRNGNKYYPSYEAEVGWTAPHEKCVKDPSEVTVLLDSQNNAGDQTYLCVRMEAPGVGNGVRMAAARHSGSCNVLFGDGHAIQADKSTLAGYGWSGTALAE